MRIEISSEHGHGGCHWSVKHDGCATWLWDGVPDVDLWLAGVGSCCESTALARTDATFRDDLRVQFDRIISSIRHSVTCHLCWPDTQNRRQMAAAAAVNRNSPAAYGSELAPELRKAAPPYAAARKRYMETGTIADKEAMLACMTLTEPDLETLGRDWEPKAARSSPSWRARHRAELAFIGAAALLGALQLAVHSILVTWLAPACLLVAVLLNRSLRTRA